MDTWNKLFLNRQLENKHVLFRRCFPIFFWTVFEADVLKDFFGFIKIQLSMWFCVRLFPIGHLRFDSFCQRSENIHQLAGLGFFYPFNSKLVIICLFSLYWKAKQAKECRAPLSRSVLWKFMSWSHFLNAAGSYTLTEGNGERLIYSLSH